MTVEIRMSPEFVARLQIETCAAAAHEINRLYSRTLLDDSHSHWEECPQWMRDSAIAGIQRVIEGDTPKMLQASWFADKVRDGWTYGPVKDADKKTHPALLPYDELPDEIRAKDRLFMATVRMMATALGIELAPIKSDI